MPIWLEHPSIPDLVRAFRTGAVSPVDALTEALDRIERWDGRLRAVVAVAADEARQAAKAAEARYRAGTPLSELDGVPVTVKDLIDLAGLPTRFGTDWATPPPPAATDAAVVRRLKAAGAVVFAKTRLLEFAYGIVNPADGPCRNPWDTARTSGGSSSGAAAGVAAGMGYGAVGTDTGGSIRIPAAYCGVFGLKPTKGRVPTAGVFPLSWTLDHVGVLTRHAADLGPLWQGLAPDAGPRLPTPERLRLGVVEPWGGEPPTPKVAAALADAADRLADGGCVLVPVTVEGLEAALPCLMVIVMAEAAAVHRGFAGRAAVRYAEATAWQIRAGEAVAAVDYLKALQVRRRLRAAVDEALTGVDALLLPTVGFVAPAEDPVFGDGEEGSREAWYTAPWNVTGHPAVSVPLPVLADGLPTALQLVGRRGEDEFLIRVVERVAEALSISVRCPREVVP
jgi:aspartyl-tRNA(Asn)/glutamyl-tRNA(Gln) amidotransferase subunit A